MNEQTKRLEAWFALWRSILEELEFGSMKPKPEGQELIDALCAMAED